jgi:hypothetical protein
MYRNHIFGPPPRDPAVVIADRARMQIEQNLDVIMSTEGVTIHEALQALYRFYERDLDADYYEARLLARLRMRLLDEMAQELLDSETYLEMN